MIRGDIQVKLKISWYLKTRTGIEVRYRRLVIQPLTEEFKLKMGLHRYSLIICVQVLSATVFGLLALAISQDSAQDSKVSVVKTFMAARALRHNVEARKRMTARLEKAYLRGKRLSIRVRSGRVAAFNFRPTSIFPIDHEKFLVSVESTWVDLNNQVSSTVLEQIKFIKINREWVADKITFLKSIPRHPVLPFNIVSEKRAKFALRVAKRFMKHIVDRDLEKTTHLFIPVFFYNTICCRNSYTCRKGSFPIYIQCIFQNILSA